MLPVYLITLKLHLVDSVNNFAGYVGLIMPFAVSAFGIFLMRQAFLGIPKEMEEAAIVDGCNVFQIFTKVLLPMVKPSLAVLAILLLSEAGGNFCGRALSLLKMLCTLCQSGSTIFRECSVQTGDSLQQVQFFQLFRL